LCAMVSSQVALEGRLAGELLRFGVAPTDIRVVEDQRVLHRLVAASLIRYLINHPLASCEHVLTQPRSETRELEVVRPDDSGTEGAERRQASVIELSLRWVGEG
jgi:hypothetical protein